MCIISTRRSIRLLVGSLTCVLAVVSLACQAKPTRAIPEPVLLAPASLLGGSADTILCRVLDYPPQYYVGSDGRWTGLDVELMRAIIEAAGLKAEFAELPWTRALEEIKLGRLDTMANLSITAEREVFLRWIGPERQARMVLVVHQDNSHLPVGTFADLLTVSRRSNQAFGVLEGAFYAPELNALIADPANHQLFEALPDSLMNQQKLIAKRILGIFEDYDSLSYKIATDPVYAELAIHPFIVSQAAVYLGISRLGVSDAHYAALLAAYQRLEVDGSLEAIRTRTWH